MTVVGLKHNPQKDGITLDREDQEQVQEDIHAKITTENDILPNVFLKFEC